ncbi:hypothetical protein [Companilactobacillus futsaii]|uniref:Uncharacterized protein n=2 Tax=Companilactobacillus futsaii TaxID=938155 RepID=A0A5B7SXP4_9LACO|nr:hypothetical protein [Companilactobacillus futsaii]QCX24666.1 hypothetical protein FG051_05860 [Companilactobacillus futsaii]
MITFGKKLSYRPLLVSLFAGLVAGFTIFIIFNNWISCLIGLGIFIVFFFIYYLNSVTVLFQYWEADQNDLRYSDLTNSKHRIFVMFFPFKNKLTAIDKKDIATIKVIGYFNNDSIPLAVPYTLYLGVLTPSLLMAKNPLALKITTTSGQNYTLDFSRDYAYNKKLTIQKLDQVIRNFDDGKIKIENQSNLNLR